MDTAAVATELAAARARTTQGAGPDGGAADAGIVEALEAQLDAARRLDGLIGGADAKLRLLDARMAEAVARAIELSAPAGDDAVLGPLGADLGADVDEVVTEMELLRQALDETRGDLPGASFGGSSLG